MTSVTKERTSSSQCQREGHYRPEVWPILQGRRASRMLQRRGRFLPPFRKHPCKAPLLRRHHSVPHRRPRAQRPQQQPTITTTLPRLPSWLHPQGPREPLLPLEPPLPLALRPGSPGQGSRAHSSSSGRRREARRRRRRKARPRNRCPMCGKQRRSYPRLVCSYKNGSSRKKKLKPQHPQLPATRIPTTPTPSASPRAPPLA
mmetsp:Transcript_21554/g.46865  ORF Transcript_21554/g.46865 Transcript_21554/m.46865 type:complete len:202 (+) Transcript_21554:488-1093(+)